MNILYLCHRIPYPPNKGDKIRSYHQLRHLAKNHQVFLGTVLDWKGNEIYRQNLECWCRQICMVNSKHRARLVRGLWPGSKPLSVHNFQNRRLQVFVNEVLRHNKIDVIMCSSSVMAEYVFNSMAFRQDAKSRPRLIMDFIDLDSAKWQQYAEHSRFPLKYIFELENRRLSAYEHKIVKLFDRCYFVSQREVELIKSQNVDTSTTTVIENGLDATYFASKAKAGDNKPPLLLFTGVMNYFANVDGVVWFCEEILPLVQLEFPDIEFRVVGMSPSKQITKLGQRKGITITGYVDDIRPHYWQADVFVAPLRIARGVQNKVLEAMATGNAAVATSPVAGGLHCRPGYDLLIADSATDFAQQVIALLRDRKKRDRIAANAVRTIHEYYDWDTNLKALDRLLTGAPIDREVLPTLCY